MATVYENIMSLCEEHGIKGGKMCVDVGISKSTLTDLKSGKNETVSAKTAQKIANYFSVSVDRILGSENKNAPATSSEREINDDHLKFALWGNNENITDADLEKVREFAAFIAAGKDKK